MYLQDKWSLRSWKSPTDMATIFTKIINREIPAHIVAEDNSFIAFLDINPLTKGHTLVVPKVEVDYIFDLDDETFLDLHAFSKKVAKALDDAIDCERIGTTVMGLEVPHTHIHLIPMDSMDDMNFARTKLSLTNEELSSIAASIQESFLKLS